MAITTRLGNGEEVYKDDIRCEVLGTIDELYSFLGFAWSFLGEQSLNEVTPLQHTLCSIMAVLSGARKSPIDYGAYNLSRLEEEFERMRKCVRIDREWSVAVGHSQFELALHVSRTICRRVERLLIKMNREYPVPQDVLDWFNRLSLWLFYRAESL